MLGHAASLKRAAIRHPQAASERCRRQLSEEWTLCYIRQCFHGAYHALLPQARDVSSRVLV